LIRFWDIDFQGLSGCRLVLTANWR
jgi:hypothetical protein